MSNFVEKKAVFKGMTLSEMKAAYSKMTPAERGNYAGAFVRAAKTAPKSKPISKSKSKSKSNSIPKSKQANTGTGRDGQFGTGTYGKGRPSGKSRAYKSLYKRGEMVGKDEKTNSKSSNKHRGGARAKVNKKTGKNLPNLTAALRKLGGADPKTGRRKKD